jgi:hypothetical protein
MPDWRDEVSGAVQAWLGCHTGRHQGPMWKQIGMARPEGQGSFVVDLRGAGQQYIPEDLETLRLCKERPGEAEGNGYRVLEAVLQAEILKVRVAAVSGRCDSHPPTSSNRYGTVWRS